MIYLSSHGTLTTHSLTRSVLQTPNTIQLQREHLYKCSHSHCRNYHASWQLSPYVYNIAGELVVSSHKNTPQQHTVQHEAINSRI